jgi:CRP-like cAMP-binding protein
MATQPNKIEPRLQQLALFQELTPEQLAKLASGTREKPLQKGEMLFQKGDKPKGFFMVVSGQIKLAFSSVHGNEKVIQVLGAQESFGEAVMFMERPYPVFAQALADAHCCTGQTEVFELLGSDPFARLLAGSAFACTPWCRTSSPTLSAPVPNG